MTLNQYRDLCHNASVSRGWWVSPDSGRTMEDEYVLATKLALIHSEVSEMLEGLRHVGWVTTKSVSVMACALNAAERPRANNTRKIRLAANNAPLSGEKSAETKFSLTANSGEKKTASDIVRGFVTGSAVTELELTNSTRSVKQRLEFVRLSGLTRRR